METVFFTRSGAMVVIVATAASRLILKFGSVGFKAGTMTVVVDVFVLWRNSSIRALCKREAVAYAV